MCRCCACSPATALPCLMDKALTSSTPPSAAWAAAMRRFRSGSAAPWPASRARQIHLAVGMPANDRMDWLVEKATELGVASIQPVMTERSVLKLSGERAEKKAAHWQSVSGGGLRTVRWQPGARGAPHADAGSVAQKPERAIRYPATFAALFACR